MEQSWLNDWPFFVFPNTFSETFAVHLLLARYHADMIISLKIKEKCFPPRLGSLSHKTLTELAS